jgi:hypothetical protein
MNPNTDPDGRPMWGKNQRNSWYGVDFVAQLHPLQVLPHRLNRVQFGA